jgi:hypothetical protein
MRSPCSSCCAASFAALPDAVSASLFLAAWFYPLRWGTGLVGNLVLVMLLEFLLCIPAVSSA